MEKDADKKEKNESEIEEGSKFKLGEGSERRNLKMRLNQDILVGSTFIIYKGKSLTEACNKI